MRAIGWRAVWALLGCVWAAASVHADSSWPRLPSDAEIDAARTALQQARNFEHGNCAARCEGIGDEVAVNVCRARECMDECRLGPEVRKSELLQIETIKAHQPLEADPVAASYVFALTTTARTRDNCQGREWAETEYAIEMLAWREQGWYWNQNRLGVDVRQQDPGNQAQRDAEFASYFGPDRLVRGFPERAAAAPAYRLALSADDAMHPLRLRIRVERLRPPAGPQIASAQPVYEPASGVRLALGATSYAGNEARLAVQLDSPNCRNCVDASVDGRRLQQIEDPRVPILLESDQAGQASVELFLDFAALNLTGQLAPAAGLTLPLNLAVLAPSAPGQPDTLQQESRYELRVPGIGVVESIRFQPSQAAGSLPQPAVPLSEYLDDPGTREGEQSLSGSARVKVKRAGEALIVEPGVAPGASLRAGHVLQVGDLITVNACGTDTRPLIDGLPAGAPAQIWVTVRYFDGLRGQFGVNAQVCRAALSIGRSRNDSGFLSPGQRFVYWAAEQGVDAAITALFAPAKLITAPREVIGWVRQGLGYDTSYVILNSALAVESDVDGRLWFSTREGAPLVLTASTGEAGVAVPVGTTAVVEGDTLSLEPTDADRSARAEAWLGALQAASVGAEAADSVTDPAIWRAPEGYGELDFTPDSESALAPWVWAVLVLALIVLYAIWLGKRRLRRLRAPASGGRKRRRRKADS